MRGGWNGRELGGRRCIEGRSDLWREVYVLRSMSGDMRVEDLQAH